MLDHIWLIPALPLAGFLLILLFGRRLGEPKAGYLAAAACGSAFVVTALVWLDMLGKDAEERTKYLVMFKWIPVGSLHIDAALLADPLSITMALFITGIGTLIHLYAIGYMHGDPKFSKFFLYLNLFAFSMLMLVMGENLLVTFLGWEGVGACSYFLISFWHTRDSAATAGKKAFVTNRVGDWGVMMAMFLAFSAVGTLSYSGINHAAENGGISTVTATAIALMLFIGACGKSAQLPLYIWLPDAMEGPTPVSALIHAATMVTSGVFLMTRMGPVLHASYEWAPTIIATIGAATALFAATIAVAQTDIKKVLAYSTVSQLGFMFLAIGSGAYVAAIFHMVTHAFFKALLFLGSGSVIHGMHHEQDMRRMGALRKVMPITAITFIIGWLAIAGVPPFSGFWSKDDILAYALHKSVVLYVIGLVTALLTAFYMSRQVFMVFFGEARWSESQEAELANKVAHETAHEVTDDDAHVGDHADAHGDAHGGHGVVPHESPRTMTIPLIVLAFFAAIAGVLNLPFTEHLEFLNRWLEPVVGAAQTQLHLSGTQLAIELLTSTVVALVGISIAYAVYMKHKVDARRIELPLFANGWYIDSSITNFMGGLGRKGFELIAMFDKVVIDGAVNGVARATRGGAMRLRTVQSGYVRWYALMIGVGAVLIVAFVLSQVSFS